MKPSFLFFVRNYIYETGVLILLPGLAGAGAAWYNLGNLIETEEPVMLRKRVLAAALGLCLLAGAAVPAQAENTAPPPERTF